MTIDFLHQKFDNHTVLFVAVWSNANNVKAKDCVMLTSFEIGFDQNLFNFHLFLQKSNMDLRNNDKRQWNDDLEN